VIRCNHGRSILALVPLSGDKDACIAEHALLVRYSYIECAQCS